MTERRNDLAWKKSTRSGSSGNCVEVANSGGLVFVRHSKDPRGSVLSFTAAEWGAFVAGVNAHEFDLIPPDQA